MGVHSGTVVAEQRLWHESHDFIIFLRDILKDVLVVHHMIAHETEGCEANVDLCLTGGRDFMVLPLDRHPGLFQFKTHFVTGVWKAIRWRNAKITLFVTDLMPEIWEFLASSVPDALDAVY